MKYKVSLNGKDYLVEVEKGEAIMLDVTDTPVAVAPVAASTAPVAPTPAAPAVASVPAGDNTVVAPMPGTVLSIKAQPGAAVKKGDVLLILEAMKMENEITAPKDGTVAQVLKAAGTSVNTGDALVILS